MILAGLLLLNALAGQAVQAGGAAPEKVPGEPESPPDAATTASLRRGDAYYHLMLARIALASGKTADASSEIREANALEPNSADLHAEGAALLLSAGRRAEAERLARRAMEIDPSQPAALRVLADLAAGRAFVPGADEATRDEAIRLYERLARESGADEELFQVLARLKVLAGDTSGAADYARRFLARRPGDAGAARLLAQILARAGEGGEAVRVLCSFLESSPDPGDLLRFVLELARSSGEWAPVERAARRVAEAEPGSSLPYAVLGETLLRLRRPREAVVELERAAALGADEALVRLHLAMAYREMGRLSDALDLAERLARDFPDHAGMRAFVGEILEERGDDAGALAAYRAALAGVPAEEPDAAARRDGFRLRIASIHAGRGRKEAAREALGTLEEPQAVEALEGRARVALRGGDLEEARRAAEGVRAAGQDAVAMMIEGEALAKEGKAERARVKFREASRALGPGALVRGAETLREAGRAGEGEALLRAWARSEPANAEAKFRLGAFLERTGRFEEATAELEASLRLNPEDPQALNYLGYALADRGQRLDEAKRLIERAVALDPWNGAFLDSLGWVEHRLGRSREALEAIRKAAREYPNDPTILEHLGDVLGALGDVDAAAESWRKALSAGPEDADALRRKIDATSGSAGKSQAGNPPPETPSSAAERDPADRPPGR